MDKSTVWPKITIVTPNFNGAKYLEQTIRSVIDQGYPNLEYILIDGGSNDGSRDIIERFRNKLTIVVSEPDNGLYHALQKGFQRSTGEVMGWLNSDDMHHPKSLFAIGEIFRQFSEVEWLMGNPTFFDEMGRTVHCWGLQRMSKYDLMLDSGRWIQQESTFWRRSLWEKAGGFVSQDFKLAGDFELWCRFALHAKLCITDTLLGGFRLSAAGQLTFHYYDDYIGEMETIRNKYKGYYNRNSLGSYHIARKLIRGLGSFGLFDKNALDMKLRSVFRLHNKIISLDRSTQNYKIS